ncbi:MAG: hypothetical protein ABIK31_01575 [candidate division WOR-3 bacterium]
MSFREIKELRQSGKLDEALKKSEEALNLDPNNIWNKRAAAWVYYDYLKKNAQPESFEAFKENLIKIKDLQLPEDEKMIFDSCAWQIGSLVFALQKTEHVDYSKINELFEIIREFHFTKPSEAYSFLYKAFHKSYQNWSNYLTFADWWNFENFRNEDYLKEEVNGLKMMSIVEQAYIAYSKKLLEGEPLDPFGQQRVIDKEKIKAFLPKLDNLIEKYPQFQYPSYFKAKLLLGLGSDENALSAFLPFAIQKRNDFWVWELLAEMFPNDKEIQFSCYCKALSLRTPEDYIVKLRQTFAKMLIEKGMYNEAKAEIQKVIETRQKKLWKIPFEILEWTKQTWFNNAMAEKDNWELYKKNLQTAEEILYQNIPEELVAVQFVDENKSILYFIKDKNKYGFFKYMYVLTKPKVGDLLLVRFIGIPHNGYYKILTAKKAEPDLHSDAVKEFDGILKIAENRKFGFINDMYIESNLIEKFKLKDGQKLKGMAVLSLDKKKNKWGWKVIEIK